MIRKILRSVIYHSQWYKAKSDLHATNQEIERCKKEIERCKQEIERCITVLQMIKEEMKGERSPLSLFNVYFPLIISCNVSTRYS